MPADRFLHPRAGRSNKVTTLTDLEYRVWTQYLLSADDFGVMHATSVALQNDNLHLANRPAKVISKCLEALIACALVLRFVHQGQPYVFQPDWQKWQKVEYPRSTINPCPPADALALCDEDTREMFSKHPGGQRRATRAKDAPNNSERASQMNSENMPTTRAGAPAERLTATANGYGSGQRLTADGEQLDVAFRAFQEAYPRERRKGGRLVEESYLTQVARAGSAAALVAALENHKASEQWQTPKLIPGMDTWLNEERWRQTLPAPVPGKKPFGNWRPAEAS